MYMQTYIVKALGKKVKLLPESLAYSDEGRKVDKAERDGCRNSKKNTKKEKIYGLDEPITEIEVLVEGKD